MSSLYFRGKTIWIGFTVNGVRKDESTGIRVPEVRKNKRGEVVFPREAVDFQERLEAKIRLNQWGIEDSKLNPVRLTDAFNLYLAEVSPDLTEGSIYQARLAVEALVALTDNCHLSAIDQSAILTARTRWLSESRVLKSGVTKKLSQNTVAKRLRQLSAFFNWAVLHEPPLMKANPISRKIRLRPKKSRPTTFTNDELRTLFGYLDEHDRDFRDQLLFLLLTGFRSGESCKLQWTDVEFEAGVLYHVNQKGHRDNAFPLHHALRSLLQSTSRAYTPYVFKYRTSFTVAQRLRRFMAQCMPDSKKRAHTLKKTFVSWAIRSGASAPQLHILANHKSMQTTMDYYNSLSAGEIAGIFSNPIFDTAIPLHPPLEAHTEKEEPPASA